MKNLCIISVIVMGIFLLPVAAYAQSSIPDWIKNNAGWWAEGQIDDTTFLQGIQFLIKESILIIPSIESLGTSESQKVPDWIKNNAGWWAEGQIDDTTFLQGIQFLIKNGIIIIEQPDFPPKVIDLVLDYNPGGERININSDIFNVYSYAEDWNSRIQAFNFVWFEKKFDYDYSKIEAGNQNTVFIIPIFYSQCILITSSTPELKQL